MSHHHENVTADAPVSIETNHVYVPGYGTVQVTKVTSAFATTEYAYVVSRDSRVAPAPVSVAPAPATVIPTPAAQSAACPCPICVAGPSAWAPTAKSADALAVPTTAAEPATVAAEPATIAAEPATTESKAAPGPAAKSWAETVVANTKPDIISNRDLPRAIDSALADAASSAAPANDKTVEPKPPAKKGMHQIRFDCLQIRTYMAGRRALSPELSRLLGIPSTELLHKGKEVTIHGWNLDAKLKRMEGQRYLELTDPADCIRPCVPIIQPKISAGRHELLGALGIETLTVFGPDGGEYTVLRACVNRLADIFGRWPADPTKKQSYLAEFGSHVFNDWADGVLHIRSRYLHIGDELMTLGGLLGFHFKRDSDQISWAVKGLEAHNVNSGN